jgi:hypothetical protein
VCRGLTVNIHPYGLWCIAVSVVCQYRHRCRGSKYLWYRLSAGTRGSHTSPNLVAASSEENVWRWTEGCVANSIELVEPRLGISKSAFWADAEAASRPHLFWVDSTVRYRVPVILQPFVEISDLSRISVFLSLRIFLLLHFIYDTYKPKSRRVAYLQYVQYDVCRFLKRYKYFIFSNPAAPWAHI